MHTVAFIVVKEQHEGTNKIFCISLEWLNNAVFSKEFAVGLKLTKKIYFGVTCPMFNRVIWVQGNDLVETGDCSWFLIYIKEHYMCQMMITTPTTTLIIIIMTMIIMVNAYIVPLTSKYDQKCITVMQLYINNLIKGWFRLS